MPPNVPSLWTSQSSPKAAEHAGTCARRLDGPSLEVLRLPCAHITLETTLSSGHTYFQGSLETVGSPMDFYGQPAASVTRTLAHDAEHLKCSQASNDRGNSHRHNTLMGWVCTKNTNAQFPEQPIRAN